MHRRTFFQAIAAGCGSAVAGGASPTVDPHGLIESIEKQTLLRGRDGSGPTWFHPRACMVPGDAGPMAFNENVFRWRSPLWLAEVDPDFLRLRRATERVVLPLVGDGVNHPDRVAIMGNFHVTNASPSESWVTDGEWLHRAGGRGDLLLARIHWARPSALASATGSAVSRSGRRRLTAACRARNPRSSETAALRRASRSS